MKQMTAVEWLIEQLHLENSQINNSLFEQAKSMEKEQIMEAFVECWKANVPDGIECKLDAEQYYNETFKSQEQRIIDMMKGDEELGIYKTE